METLKAPNRNIAGGLADLLLSAKQKANKYEIKEWVPLLGGTGFGDLFMGEAPELVDDISYEGLGALRTGGNSVTGGLGTYGVDKRTLDAAMLGLDAYGVTKGSSMLGKALANKAYKAATSGDYRQSRRDLMKGLGATGALTAVGGAGVLAKKTSQKLADNVAKKTVENIPKYEFNSLKEYADYLKTFSEHANISPQYMARREAEQYDAVKFRVKKGMHPLIDNPEKILSRFSPKAKQEMRDSKPKNWKNLSFIEKEKYYDKLIHGVSFEKKASDVYDLPF